MVDINDAVTRILNQRTIVPRERSLLVGLSGIDGSGKGYVAQQIVARLALYSTAAAKPSVDGWQPAPQALRRPRARETFLRKGGSLRRVFQTIGAAAARSTLGLSQGGFHRR